MINKIKDIHIVLLDVMMADMNGIDIREKIHN